MKLTLQKLTQWHHTESYNIASHPDLSLLDNDDCERLQIIAVQLNEFIPILRDIMTKRVSMFANYQFPAF